MFWLKTLQWVPEEGGLSVQGVFKKKQLLPNVKKTDPISFMLVYYVWLVDQYNQLFFLDVNGTSFNCFLAGTSDYNAV